jgi:hypothetical protein
MKRFAFFFILLFPVLSWAQEQSLIKISKLEIDPRRSYEWTEGDSTLKILIDTLVMNDRSKLVFVGKKAVDLTVNHAQIGKESLIMGDDSKNNGTNLTLNVNFEKLRSLFVDVSGQDARMRNRHYNNGNGGHVVINYLASGVKPQIGDKRTNGYLSVKNQGGGYTVNPQTDIAVIMDRIRQGNPGRPLGQFPNGRVYSGGVGREGKTAIKAVDRLPALN